jgi:hypothetical protein
MRQRYSAKAERRMALTGSVNQPPLPSQLPPLPASQLDPKGRSPAPIAGCKEVASAGGAGRYDGLRLPAGPGDSAQIISGTAMAKTIMKLSMTAAYLPA